MIRANRENLGYSIAAVAITLVVLLPTGLLDKLLAANSFIPHGHCYLWKPGLIWLHVLSDSLITLAYVAISATLAYLVYKTRQEIPFHWMFLAFGSFIVACASTHFMEVWTLWHPTYWLSGVLKLLTAIASVATAIVLPPLVPKALTMLQTAKLSEERKIHLERANQELATLYEKLKELDQLKSQFFTNVSHELRTPLALILGPTERLLSDHELNEEQHYQLDVINRNSRLLLKQVNDLLDVSKLEVGKMEVNYAEVDLVQLLRLMTANFDGLAQERQISFTVETPDALQAQVDVTKMQRILLNLLSNAFKFTPVGGSIRCVLSTHSVPTEQSSDVDLSGREVVSERAQIMIQDNGPGIPTELREVIFDRFRQGEGGATRRFGGTGLGLAIVKEFVELQEGTITVNDAANGGALFTVELPLAAPRDATVSTSALSLSDTQDIIIPALEELRIRPETGNTLQEEAAEKPLVLVVEDNPEMNRFITEILAKEYRTATATDGQKGLEQALLLSPDLIISDVMMPLLSGDQLLQKLRSHPEMDAIPVVMLTAKADHELRVQLLKTGAQDYLIKPFSVEELRARVGNLIMIKRVRNLLQQELATQSYDLEALAQEVSLRRRELQIAYEALQHQAKELAEANRLKDEFLAIVSHELQTPLNMILGWAKMLRERQLTPDTIERALETIERNAELQTQLIKNLLDMSRLLRGKMLLNMCPVELAPVIQKALQAVQPVAEAKGIKLESSLTSSSLVSGDAQRLEQIVENLLGNAIKFTPTGGRVEIELTFSNEQLQISIGDTGEGISADVLPHVFDYFRQADSSTTRKHGGLGLGLAIVRRLVELHNGTIEAESPGEGQGATFTVKLPLSVTSNLPRYLY
ncbi:ATP-binding protein [Lyngbya aestuarii]|uniref:ATP-binding protein n=1 Tax=Lyngbya aestuarii TaxID=118322 RepID=UPI00403E0A1C